MHKLLTDNPGNKMLLLGNEAIARGAVEAGLAFARILQQPLDDLAALLGRVLRPRRKRHHGKRL